MAHATTPISRVLDVAIRRESQKLSAKIAVIAKDDDDAIRRARIASRRLRESLALVRVVTPGARAAHLGRDVRKFTRALGPVREMDVALETLGHAAARHGWRRSAVAAVRRHLEHARDERRRALHTALDRLDADSVEKRATRFSEKYVSVAPDAAVRRALATRIARRSKDAAGALAALGTLYAPERLHALRIAVKKLRYAVELLESAADGARETVRALKRGQRQLGHLHDLQGLLAEVRATATDLGSTPLAGRVLEIADGLERECRERYAEALAGTAALAEAVDHAGRRLVVTFGAGRPSMSRAFAPAATSNRQPRRHLPVARVGRDA